MATNRNPPATLYVQLPNQPVQEIPLEHSKYRIGREADNDIVLPLPIVSRRHAFLEKRGETWYYVDMDSHNGTWHGGQKIKEVAIQDATVLRIGEKAESAVEMTFKVAAQAAETGEKTGLIHIRSYQAPSGKPLTIGRGGEADIQLPAPAVSRRHAVLQPSGDEWVLNDLNSTNGTFVNGQRISAPRRLAAGDVIQIGPFRLAYEGGGIFKLQAASRGLRLDGHSVIWEVGSKEKRKRILEDINVAIYPQEFIGLVGGSGAGKTTLMKAMSGLLPPTEGQVLVEGEPLYENYEAYRQLIGYVPQDDILHKELTVEEALRYSARLRLPPDIGEDEIEARIERVLEQVELSGQRKQVINSLSGGQRKRASIAVELLADPPLFFLDEPTSGLDPGLEKKMMVTLRKLANGGKTIVLVTHATANISECDHVAFMSQGHIDARGVHPHNRCGRRSGKSLGFRSHQNRRQTAENHPHHCHCAQPHHVVPPGLPGDVGLWDLPAAGSLAAAALVSRFALHLAVQRPHPARSTDRVVGAVKQSSLGFLGSHWTDSIYATALPLLEICYRKE